MNSQCVRLCLLCAQKIKPPNSPGIDLVEFVACIFPVLSSIKWQSLAPNSFLHGPRYLPMRCVLIGGQNQKIISYQSCMVYNAMSGVYQCTYSYAVLPRAVRSADAFRCLIPAQYIPQYPHNFLGLHFIAVLRAILHRMCPISSSAVFCHGTWGCMKFCLNWYFLWSSFHFVLQLP